MKVMKIQALKSGTAIDHLPSGTALEVLKVLGIDDTAGTIAIGMNLESRKMGGKDIIKIENKELTQQELNKIALVAPQASISIIKDYEVAKKLQVNLPKIITGIVKCFNPNCITNQDKVTTKFHVINEKPIKIRCHYCERYMKRKDIKLT
jgi:aspartate carbamoyltransferase regulatory subunit